MNKFISLLAIFSEFDNLDLHKQNSFQACKHEALDPIALLSALVVANAMPSADKTTSSASSGIQTTESGERHIPQSVRADGSIRKEIKVRPGYRPPEDVGVYKNRTAEAWKTRGSNGIPGAQGLDEHPEPSDSKKGKNAKRREARKKAKAADQSTENQHSEEEPMPKESMATSASSEQLNSQLNNGENSENDADVEREKRARSLKKKLRQARELREKKESGGALLPEQFAKVIKIQELIRQLDVLGFDSDGVEKPIDVR